MTFPNDQYIPAERAQSTPSPAVSAPIAIDFFGPEGGIGGWPKTPWARVTVPKATVDQYNFFSGGKY
jgi:hypothetical protein